MVRRERERNDEMRGSRRGDRGARQENSGDADWISHLHVQSDAEAAVRARHRPVQLHGQDIQRRSGPDRARHWTQLHGRRILQHDPGRCREIRSRLVTLCVRQVDYNVGDMDRLCTKFIFSQFETLNPNLFFVMGGYMFLKQWSAEFAFISCVPRSNILLSLLFPTMYSIF